MSKANVYLNFPGRTREAMEFYKSCFGGDLVLLPIAGSAIENDMPAEMRSGVLHSSLVSDGVTLMASDCGGPEGFKQGNTVSIYVACDTEDQIHAYYAKLSEGGNASHPVSPAFWGGLFGTCTDKFGIQWLMHQGGEGLG